MKNTFIRIKLFIRKDGMAFYVLCSALLFLAGCAPGSLLLREADLQNMQQRLADQERLIASIIAHQDASHEILVRIAEKSENNQECCQPMLSCLEKIMDNQAAGLCLLEEIHKKLTPKNYRKLPDAPVSAVPLPAPETLESSKIIVGAVEHVHLTPPGMIFPALMDTGAETSSLDARNIKRFERDGDRWVRFDVINPETGKMIPVEQRLQRKTRILQSISDEFERRLVVELSFSFNGITQIAEFTLADRSHLSYPVLIGRNILKDVMVVDVGRPAAEPANNKDSSAEKTKQKDAH